MSDIRQLPGSYLETFREAVEAVNDFARGGRERSVTYEGRPVRVGYIIGVASQYRDVIRPISIGACARSRFPARNRKTSPSQRARRLSAPVTTTS